MARPSWKLQRKSGATTWESVPMSFLNRAGAKVLSNSSLSAGEGIVIFVILLRRRAGDHVRLPGGDDDLDGVLDPIPRISERRGQIGEREGVGVDFRGVEPLFRH